MKRKYAIERFKLYAIFGEYGYGRVSLCMDGRELAAVTKEQVAKYCNYYQKEANNA